MRSASAGPFEPKRALVAERSIPAVIGSNEMKSLAGRATNVGAPSRPDSTRAVRRGRARALPEPGDRAERLEGQRHRLRPLSSSVAAWCSHGRSVNPDADGTRPRSAPRSAGRRTARPRCRRGDAARPGGSARPRAAASRTTPGGGPIRHLGGTPRQRRPRGRRHEADADPQPRAERGGRLGHGRRQVPVAVHVGDRPPRERRDLGAWDLPAERVRLARRDPYDRRGQQLRERPAGVLAGTSR